MKAIRHEDCPHSVWLWKLWLPQMIGTGCKNYLAECVQILSKLCAHVSRHLSYIAIHNHTLSMEGKTGRWKP